MRNEKKLSRVVEKLKGRQGRRPMTPRLNRMFKRRMPFSFATFSLSEGKAISNL